MKKATQMMALFLLVAGAAFFAACGEDEKEVTPEAPLTWENPDPSEYTPSGTYAFHYGGKVVETGTTIEYTVTESDYAAKQVMPSVAIENKTDVAEMSSQEVVKIEGPESIGRVDICGNGSCPWDGKPYELAPGMNEGKPVAIEFDPNVAERPYTVLFRVTVGKGSKLNDPETIFLRVIAR